MGDERSTDFREYRRQELGLQIPARTPMHTPPQREAAGSGQEPAPAFPAETRRTPPRYDDRPEERERVSHRIAGAITGFFATRAPGTEFHADDLRRHVAGQCGQVAPDSARRIAASMKPHAINFECVNRAQSLFRVLQTQPHQRGGE